MGIFRKKRDPHAKLPPPPVVAAVQPAIYMPRVRVYGDEPWQGQVRKFDRDGPGFVGFALDLKSQVAAMATLVPQYRSDRGTWAVADNPAAHAALQAFTGVDEEQSDLVKHQYRATESVGEYWLVAVDEPVGIRWLVAQTPQLEFRGDTVLVRDRSEDWVSARVVPRSAVVRCWNPDPDWPGLAYSAFRRALPDIRRYKSIVRNIHRTVDSRLLTNGLVWFPPDDPDDGIDFPENDTPVQSVDKNVQEYLAAARRGLEDDSSFEAYAPYPTNTRVKPEYVDVGRQLDPEVIAAENNALEAVARELDLPMQILTQGPGAGNHWSDYLLADDFLKTGVAPKLGMVCNNMTRASFRPTLVALKKRGITVGDVSRYRVWYDLTEAAKRPDASDKLLRAWELGLASFRAAGAGVGLAEDEQLEIPPGIGEYKHWLQAIGQGDTQVPTKREGAKRPDPSRALPYAAQAGVEVPQPVPFPPYGRGWDN